MDDFTKQISKIVEEMDSRLLNNISDNVNEWLSNLDSTDRKFEGKLLKVNVTETPIIALIVGNNDLVKVTSIDFNNRTFTWNYKGHLENTESFDDAVFYVLNGNE